MSVKARHGTQTTQRVGVEWIMWCHLSLGTVVIGVVYTKKGTGSDGMMKTQLTCMYSSSPTGSSLLSFPCCFMDITIPYSNCLHSELHVHYTHPHNLYNHCR